MSAGDEEVNMISAVAGTLVVLSMGILLAHAVDMFRPS
jgi:hypothetical protein